MTVDDFIILVSIELRRIEILQLSEVAHTLVMKTHRHGIVGKSNDGTRHYHGVRKRCCWGGIGEAALDLHIFRE